MLKNINPSRQTRVLAMHDISCIGKCSITAALPILSAAGIETAVLPTAILSTHTGGFKGYTFRDLTDDIMPVINHWEKEGIDFDAVYTGYLGSYEQINIMKEIFSIYKKKDALIFVDPVMGDNGRLYSAFDDSFPKGMLDMCAYADIITPNITEASLMLGEKYSSGPYEKKYIEDIMRRLSGICGGSVVLTGVCFDENMLGAATYDASKNKTDYSFARRIDGMYHGTGDVFASAFLASLLNGNDMKKSADIAVEFAAQSIRQTLKIKQDRYYGVNFEAAIPWLINNI